MTKLQKVSLALSTCTGVMDFIFHLGYQGIEMPVLLRKVLAKTEVHRAWFGGFYGGGVLGVLDRHLNEEINH